MTGKGKLDVSVMSAFDLIDRLTRDDIPYDQLPQWLSEFSYHFGWRPSNVDGWQRPSAVGNAHLMVEHGLQNSAVLTFLPRNRPASNLQIDEWHQLLGISYNNLVDWHVIIDRDFVQYVYNRTDPVAETIRAPISQRDYSALQRDAFEEKIARAPRPNIPSLDDALIETISRWKRLLGADLGPRVSNRNFSALFNAILLVRVIEDLRTPAARDTLLDVGRLSTLGVVKFIEESIRRLTERRVPNELWNPRDLEIFERVDSENLLALFGEFYRHRGVPYAYDFAVISKQALSRIYEKYVSMLRYEDSPQMSFLPAVPDEEVDKATGAIYTPQFIAKFFARFIQENLSPATFKTAKIADMACGSGIFLRSVMEAQLQAAQRIRDPDVLPEALTNLLGVDIDENACAASRLSLAVLYLAASGEFPTDLPITNAEAIDYWEEHTELRNTLDAYLVNPPFVRVEAQSPAVRTKIASFMADISVGRLDAYLPFIVIGLNALKPGRFGLFVLPESFLTSSSAKGVRAWILKNAWIRCLADLSAVRVFDKLGSYVVLLILEKKAVDHAAEPPATVISCQHYPGHALQDYLDGKRLQTRHYSVHDVPQSAFAGDPWSPPTPREAAIQARLARLSPLSDLADTAQGVITGADEVFIIPADLVPESEEAAYRPYLPDRVMVQYWPLEESGSRIFYPFEADRRLDEAEVEERFPITWRRISAERERLEGRSAVRRGDNLWWELAWPRRPSRLLCPKIIGPTVTLLPRFSLDLDGQWVIGRSPYVRLKPEFGDEDLLKYLLAILNSSTAAWYLRRNSRKFRGGYSKIEAKTVRGFPVPDPSTASPESFSDIIALVDKLQEDLSSEEATKVRQNMDAIVAGLYGWTAEEIESVIS